MRSRPLRYYVAALALGAGTTVAMAAPFIPGNLAVIQIGPGVGAGGALSSSPTALSVLEFAPVGLQAGPLQTISTPLFASGTGTSVGYLSTSQDRGLLTFTGVTTTSAGNANAVTSRAAGTVDASGVYALGATYTGASGDQVRGATTFDNSGYLITDQGGFYTNGSAATTLAGNFRNVRVFGSTAYTLRQSGTAGTTVVSSVGGTLAAPSITGLPGLSNDGNAQDFYMISSGSSGSAFDVLYVTSGNNLAKFSLVAGSWASNGSVTLASALPVGMGLTSMFGLAARLAPTGGVDLFATAGTSGTNNVTAVALVGLTDASGYNTPINVIANAGSVLYRQTVAQNSGFRLAGVEFVAVPTPGAAALVGLGGIVAARRRRA